MPSSWLERAWYSTSAPWALRPLAWLFQWVVAARRSMYAVGLLPSGHPGVPVIVVGNISVGGTGKTPLTLWLTDHLAVKGLRVGIATRGYGGSHRRARIVAPDADPREFGDEPVLLARRAGCLVCVAARRLDAARELVARGCEVIVCDDGLQHLALRRDIEIAVVDSARGLGNGWMLPAGPLRESTRRLVGVDMVVVNGTESPDLGVAPEHLVRMALEPGEVHALAGSGRASLGDFRGRPVQAYAGIGNPERFFAMLRADGITFEPHPFADHHPYEKGDFATGDDHLILMTEKDAVKCARIADGRMWYVPVTAQIAEADAARLMARVDAALAAGEKVGA
ncbi:MAG: tetraacyldisaccharide 4'-kinase [Pseudomonadota bacterium]